MAQAELNDGQRLLAVNDLFIGARTHVSARYRLRYRGPGGGPVVQRADRLHRRRLDRLVSLDPDRRRGDRPELTSNSPEVRDVSDQYAIPWEARCLVFSVREPFISKTSGAEIVHGTIAEDQPLEIISHMPQNGVIFSDGVEEDRLDFNTGAIAEISLADRTLSLVVPPGHPTRWPEQQRSRWPGRSWRGRGSQAK